ncbi:hypothetical protein SAMN05660199_01442 [Klenkia soli]|uniref:Uncharacterized protein n=1 Tax=Klenkia soli TaxID=1052260 RepID=A0A1H0HF41_9ACTN|nr:hypothetical protein [Klenkia soli]SDO17782.1 hypothetical protein SAMN05660199_01442 [Klenkia soli]
MISTTTTKAPTYAGAFAVRGVDAVAGGVTAAERTTGLPVGGHLRLRPVVDVPMTGLPIGATAVQLNSDTPGDLPPRDPLS